jgi:hypothetical protein
MTRLLPEPGVDHATVRPIPSPRAYIEDLLRLIVMKLISGPDKRLKGDEATSRKAKVQKYRHCMVVEKCGQLDGRGNITAAGAQWQFYKRWKDEKITAVQNT